jgi:hypothetical protein
MHLKSGLGFNETSACFAVILKILEINQKENWVEQLDAMPWLFRPISKLKRPFVKVGLRKYYLPKVNGIDTSAAERAMANKFFLLHHKTKDDTYLYYFLACICKKRCVFWWLNRLRPSYEGNDAHPFNGAKVEGIADKLKKMPVKNSLVAVFWWQQENEAFFERHKKVYEGAKGGKSIYENAEGWEAALEDVAESGALGDLDKVWNTNADTVWGFLKHKRQQQEKI